MEWSEFLNTDTFKLTVVPGVLVLLVLVFWFKRSTKKKSAKIKMFGRAPNSRHVNLDLSSAIAESHHSVRVGQGYAVDTLEDEIVSVDGKRVAKNGYDDPLTMDDDIDYSATMKFNRRDDDLDFLDEVDNFYNKPARKEVRNDPAPKPVAKTASAPVVQRVEPQRKEDIVYSYDDEASVAAKRDSDAQPAAPLKVEAKAKIEAKANIGAKANIDAKAKIEAKAQLETKAESKVTDQEDQSDSPGLILVLNVMANGGRQLRGPAILKAMAATGLTYGAMNIFHSYHPSRPGKPMFSIANMIEPGSFTLSNMEELNTPGLILFANVARAEEGINTFTVMHETAKRLAEVLDAEVCDERRSTLSRQGVEHIHGQIREHQRRSRIAQPQVARA